MKDKNKIIVSIVTIAIILIGVFVYAKPAENENNKEINITKEITTSHPANIEDILSAKETFYDFGTIRMKDGNVSKMFEITNLTGGDVVLERVTTSCMCTVAYIIDGENKKGPFGMPGHGGPVPKANYTIKTGGIIKIEAIFDPNAHGPAGVGIIERVVRLEYDNGKILNLNFKAIVTP